MLQPPRSGALRLARRASRADQSVATSSTFMLRLSSISGKGRFSRISKFRSLVARISSVACISVWPIVSRAPQRLIEATQSTAGTGSLSWKRSPSRRRNCQSRPLFETSCPSTNCGRVRNSVSTP